MKYALKYITETPIRSQNCPRQNGYFGHEDLHVCDKFFYCVDGHANMYTCPAGLVFNPKTGICTWADEAGRTGCSSEGILLEFLHDELMECSNKQNKFYVYCRSLPIHMSKGQ